jgi:hypothetical protein
MDGGFCQRLLYRDHGGPSAGPDVTPRSEMQEALDTAFDHASPAVKARFGRLAEDGDVPVSADSDTSGAQALKVAIAVVVNESKVLVVCRRGEDGGGISWQFPAGMVKLGVASETVAIRETLAETGVHCSIVRKLGSRIHPITHVHCDYLLCAYLTGMRRTWTFWRMLLWSGLRWPN